MAVKEPNKVGQRERVFQVPRRTLDSWIDRTNTDVIVVDGAVVVDSAQPDVADSVDAFNLPLDDYLLLTTVDAVSSSGCDLNILSTGSNCASTRDGPLV